MPGLSDIGQWTKCLLQSEAGEKTFFSFFSCRLALDLSFLVYSLPPRCGEVEPLIKQGTTAKVVDIGSWGVGAEKCGCWASQKFCSCHLSAARACCL
jgi:hypothetical protein